MSLFIFEKDQILLTEDVRRIKVFSEVLERENNKTLLAFIFHSSDWSSYYADMPEQERIEQLKEDFLDGEEPDELVVEACKRYKQLSETSSSKLLNAARVGAYSLQHYFETIDPSASDNPGREAKDLMTNLSKVGELLNKFDEWESIIRKEQDKADVRKGVVLNKYNM